MQVACLLGVLIRIVTSGNVPTPNERSQRICPMSFAACVGRQIVVTARVGMVSRHNMFLQSSPNSQHSIPLLAIRACDHGIPQTKGSYWKRSSQSPRLARRWKACSQSVAWQGSLEDQRVLERSEPSPLPVAERRLRRKRGQCMRQVSLCSVGDNGQDSL